MTFRSKFRVAQGCTRLLEPCAAVNGFEITGLHILLRVLRVYMNRDKKTQADRRQNTLIKNFPANPENLEYHVQVYVSTGVINIKPCAQPRAQPCAGFRPRHRPGMPTRFADASRPPVARSRSQTGTKLRGRRYLASGQA